MKWQGREGSKNVRDMRGQTGSQSGGQGGAPRPGRIPIPIPGGSGRRTSGGRSGGIGCFGILIVLVLIFMMTMGGGLLGGNNSGFAPTTQSPSQTQTTGVQEIGRSDDEMAMFVSVVLADTEELWTEKFAEQGETYRAPTMNIFDGSIQSACGIQSAAVGPFYCPGDETVNIDLTFYRQLTEQLGAKGGDLSMGYVVAHEVGHHVQNLLGINQQVNQQRQYVSESEANRLTVRMELQADYLAGVWARWEEEQGYLEEGDLDEALDAAFQIGDDTLQKRGQGYVVPDSFTHGTSEQRVRWFNKGYEAGDLSQFDTFSVPYDQL